MRPAVEEHLPDDFGKNAFSRAGDAGVVKQVASLIFRFGKELFRQPSDNGGLKQPFVCLQKFKSVQNPSILILPASAGSKQLFED